MYLGAKVAIDTEVTTLEAWRIYQLILCLIDINIVMCKWVFTLKYHIDSSITCHKVCLVAWGLT